MAVAAAGGSSNVLIACLLGMECWIDHRRARKFDLIPVKRWSRDYRLMVILEAAGAIVRETVHLAALQ